MYNVVWNSVAYKQNISCFNYFIMTCMLVSGLSVCLVSLMSVCCDVQSINVETEQRLFCVISGVGSTSFSISAILTLIVDNFLYL